MYDKELITPKFDIREFARSYTARRINVDAEGYKIIPEAKKYFEDLPIPIELLNEVDDINQEGSIVYGQIIPFWNGKDETFNIESTDDLKLLPNLKSVTLLYDDEEKMVEEFKIRGIDAEYV